MHMGKIRVARFREAGYGLVAREQNRGMIQSIWPGSHGLSPTLSGKICNSGMIAMRRSHRQGVTAYSLQHPFTSCRPTTF
jgi:hypothetical protein